MRLKALLGAEESRRRLLFGEQGTELVEAAMTIPLLVMLLIGAIWFARAYNTTQTLTRAAREGARFAVAPTCATCGNTYPTDAEVRAVVDAVLTASQVDPARVTNFSILRGQPLNPGTIPLERGTVISFDYPFTLVLPFTPLGLTSTTLPVHVQMREE